MKKHFVKRALAAFLALLIALSCVACGGGKGNGWQDDIDLDDESGSTGKYSKDEIVDIVILAEEYGDPGYPRSWQQDGMAYIRKMAREEFGLNLILEEVIGGDNYKTILNTKLAAKKNVPDVIRYDYNTTEVNNMYFKDQILDLTPYTEYMPNLMAALEEIPSLKTGICSSDGSILRMPSITYNIQHVSSWGCIRRDWLDALGLKSPATTEEFRNVLRAFQENDMNGNGLKDEVYMAYYETMNMALAPAFGVYSLSEATKSWYVDENGKVYSSMLTDEARNYAEYVSSMFNEGLFWSESFTDNGSQSMTVINENRRAGLFGRYWDSLLQSIDCYNYGRPDEYNPMLPLTDGTHEAKLMIQNYEGSCYIMLSKACPAPERVVAFFDWCYNEDVTDIIYSGDAEGKYYREIPLSDVLTPDELALLNLKGDETTSELTEAGKELEARERSMVGYLGGNTSLWPMLAINTGDEIAMDFYTTYDRAASRSSSDLALNSSTLNWPYEEGHSFNNLTLAVMDQEQNMKFLAYSDLFVYMNEMFRKFLSGAEPMSHWDSFVEECYKQGMNDVLEIIQERYDALNK